MDSSKWVLSEVNEVSFYPELIIRSASLMIRKPNCMTVLKYRCNDKFCQKHSITCIRGHVTFTLILNKFFRIKNSTKTESLTSIFPFFSDLGTFNATNILCPLIRTFGIKYKTYEIRQPINYYTWSGI